MNRLAMPGMLAAIVAAAMLASCSSKVTQEQLTQLSDLRRQKDALNSQISAKEQEKNRVQGDVNARRADLDKCNTNKQFVSGKLAQWPDVWPDWKYVPESQAPAPTPAKRRR